MVVASLQTLPKQILDRILEDCHRKATQSYHPKFYKVHRDFREYAQLCRSLRESAQPFVSRRVVFERYNQTVEGVDKRELSHDETKAAKRQPPQIKWLTNMHAVVAMDATDAVTEVVISSFDRYPLPDDVLAMLERMEFAKHDWTSVTRLYVNFKADYDLDDKDVLADEDDDDDDASETNDAATAAASAAAAIEWIPDDSFAALASYLETAIPNVDTLWMDENRCRRVGPRSAMSGYIADRIDKFRTLDLRFAHMPAFGVKVLPTQLTRLTLSVHSAYDYIDIPRIAAPTLRSLTLASIPLHYLWDRFCSGAAEAAASATSTVVFEQLRRLELSFHMPYRSVPIGKTEDDLMWERWRRESGVPHPSDADASLNVGARLKTVSVKERAPRFTQLKTTGRRPHFPRLRHLQLSSYPGRISEILKDMPLAQLRSLDISGDMVSFKGIRLGGMHCLQRSTLACFSDSPFRESAHGNRVLAKALAQGPSVRSLSVSASTEYRIRVPPADRITCTGLRVLSISGQVSYADIPALLRQLPVLECLDLQRARFVKPPPAVRTAEGMAAHMLASDMRPISTSLVKFVPDVLLRNATDDIVFYNILMLIARVPSLRELKMFSFYSTQFFRELLPLFKIHKVLPFVRHLAALDYTD
ncbi:hypothetical protein H4217_000506 [Coemansia sp. RSA 1939]|nr:hypothetical protein H4217_000506 [Coemansia sp. RSA 1939]KAJ2617556.1 hypothetical protein EV177_000519 [Coemansia sp. RSA 1804]KAJ2691950.1 hypothetical protein GGH99_002050 [Coemansia sp. RSA 1285]